MQNTTVRFANDSGEMLTGILTAGSDAPRAYALFAHCFTCGKDLKSASNIARALAAEGIAVLRFDFTGLGDSDGDFSESNFSSNVDDLLAAVRYLADEFEAPVILVGHSLGGTAMLQAASRIPSALAVATIASPADPLHVRHLLSGAQDELARRGQAVVRLGGRPFTIRKQFLDDLEQHDLEASIGALRKPLLVMHAPLDDIVEVDNASALFLAAKHPKSFVSLDDADHLLSNDRDSRYAGHVLAAWASRYLPAAGQRASLEISDYEVAASTESGGFRTDVIAAGHSLTVDEPAEVGGGNSGPSPYDLLSAALASCTSMTLRMYASFKKLELDAVTVRVRHGKVHAEDCADCETREGKIDVFERELEIKGALTGAQRQRMLEIADRCPVHRTLGSEVKIETRLGD